MFMGLYHATTIFVKTIGIESPGSPCPTIKRAKKSVNKQVEVEVSLALRLLRTNIKQDHRLFSVHSAYEWSTIVSVS